MKYLVSAVSLTPYLLVAWAFTALGDGEWATFWGVLLALIVVRALFGLLDMLCGILQWRLWGRTHLVSQALNWFKTHQFPQRQFADDDLGNYLARIADDPGHPIALTSAAKELEGLFGIFEGLGILAGARFRLAYQDAFEQYAPRSRAERQSVEDDPYFLTTANKLQTSSDREDKTHEHGL